MLDAHVQQGIAALWEHAAVRASYAANTYEEAASTALEREKKLLEPFFLYKPLLFLDGNQWCALYGTNIQEGVCGFGESPEKAVKEFNHAWKHLH